TMTFDVYETHSLPAPDPPTRGSADERGVLVDADEELPVTKGSTGSVDQGRSPALQHVEVGDDHHPATRPNPGMVAPTSRSWATSERAAAPAEQPARAAPPACQAATMASSTGVSRRVWTR